MKDDAANQQEEFLDQILEPISASMAMEACIMWHHELVDLCVNQNLCIENNKVCTHKMVSHKTQWFLASFWPIPLILFPNTQELHSA